MSRLRRSAAALGATTFLVAASALLAMPAASAADTISTKCGSSETGKVGDTVRADTSVLGLSLGSVNLGTVQKEGTSVLSQTVAGLVCEVTVTVTKVVDESADAVNEAAPEPLKSVTEPATGAVKGGTEELRRSAGATPEQEKTPDKGSGDPSDKPSSDDKADYVPQSNSAPYSGSVPGFSSLPYSGFTPINAFSTPYNSSPLFDVAPGLRYGTGFPGYAPDFGFLGEDGQQSSQDAVQNAGRADVLPPARDGAGLPVLFAVLALAGASAGLVRTWVLRQALSYDNAR